MFWGCSEMFTLPHIWREDAAGGKSVGGTRDFSVVDLKRGARVLNARASPAYSRQRGEKSVGVLVTFL
jgi:hypothetical protein